MSERPGRLTDRTASSYPPPAAGYAIHWCPQTPGFGVRVTANGARAWIAERRLNGKTVRRTLGRANGRGAISADAARKLRVEVSSELQRGIDRAADERAARAAARAAEAAEGLTFGVAVEQYVKTKRRTKDGLPLKARTRLDYLKMIAPGGTVVNERTGKGHAVAAGELYAIASMPLARLSADDIRAAHKAAAARGRRRGTYAMQVLRAVLNWHGVAVPGNPLGRDVAGKERIVLGTTAGTPTPIPPERLAAWWQASGNVRSVEAANFFRLMLLTGARGIELKTALVRDADAEGGRIFLKDTKNRSDRVLLLSKQAAAIVAKQTDGKKPGAPLFTVGDPKKTLRAINKAAGVSISGHDLRATFASVAEELVSAYTLKRMLNHAAAGDVTGGHYVAKSEAQLRAGWQAVADFIAGPAA